MKKLLLTFSIFMLVFLSGIKTFAQTTQASISGTITDQQKKPISGASVQVRNESTGFSTKSMTNAIGVYTFKELPLGGPYTVKVSFVGLGEQTRTGYMLNQGDAIKVPIGMQPASQTLEVVNVVASGLRNKAANFGAATTVSDKLINKLPVNGRNFTSLMDLSPLARGGSISGQLGSSTNYTIDGMNAKNPTSAGSTTSRSGAPYSISIEAVREFKVITNQYDVTFGRTGGGVVSAVTKAGTNDISGSAFSYLRGGDWLSSRFDIRGNKRDLNFSTLQYGFTLGGAIVKDKLHYFVAWDHQRDTRPLIVADIASPTDEARFNITTATLDRLVEIGRQKYGVANTPQFGSFNKKRGSDAGLARIDWQINDKNLLTVRNNYTNDRNPLGLEDNTPINFFESYANDKSVDNSLLATLRSQISSRVTNELKVQHLFTYQNSSPGNQLPSTNIPRALLENTQSPIVGRTLATNVQLGGHRFAQESFTNNVLQLVDNFYYNTDKAKYTFGVDLMYTRANSIYGSEVNGRFHFINSGTNTTADNFNNLTPYRFFREVPLVQDLTVKAGIFNTAIYGQMQTKLAFGLDITAGLRLDYSKYPKSPLNQLVLDELGLRTDNELSLFLIQPRVQFDWDVNEKHTDYIRFGAGIFASDINNYVTINNLTFDGKRLGTVDVRGANVPTPNFPGYRNNPSSIPTLAAFQLPTINTNATDAQVPVIYKANLSYSKLITDKLKVGITAFATLGRHNYMYVDRNMAINPFFTLANEDNRGVYVPASTMPANGAADWQQGRISTKLGRVLELNSKGRVNQFAAVLDATYQYAKDAELTLSYTLNDTRDNTSYNGNVANTATLVLPVKDNPRDLSKMSYSDNQFRHKIVFFGTLPTFLGISTGLRYSGIGGTRYNLLAGGNINGDFVTNSNDLAFVFDRNNPNVPQNVRTGLQALLDNPSASQSLKNYILKYSGKIAERNGGINGFYGIFDLRLAKKINLNKKQNIEFSADVFNVANLIKKRWGVNESLTGQTLYALGIPAVAGVSPAVPNFDTTNRVFNYRVNNTGIVNPTGNPYQFQFGLRYGF